MTKREKERQGETTREDDGRRGKEREGWGKRMKESDMYRKYDSLGSTRSGCFFTPDAVGKGVIRRSRPLGTR